MFNEILIPVIASFANMMVALLPPFLFANHIRATKSVPSPLLLKHSDPGIFLGLPLKGMDRQQFYAGRPMEEEGHILCTGGPGSGKTRHMVMNTIQTWSGLQVVLAIKGGLATFCDQIAHKTGRDIVVFNPISRNSGVYYDPFAPARRDPNNIAGHMWDIAVALIPDTDAGNQKVWISAAQNFLAGALAYYCSQQKSFVEAIDLLSIKPFSALVDEIMERGGSAAKQFVGTLQEVQDHVLQNIGLELNSLARFCSIPAVRSALTDNGGKCLDWHTFSANKRPTMVVLDFPEASFDQCEPLFRLVVNQMIKAMEERPERTYGDQDELPLLIQMDEFARLGKVPAIIHGLSTLRSRGVSFILYIQSVANLDGIYGTCNARVIRDNCAYFVALGATDVESQRYLSAMVGTVVRPHLSASVSITPTEPDCSDASLTVSSSIHADTARELAAQPEAFRTLKQAVISSPYGAFQVDKSLCDAKVLQGGVR